MLLILTAQDKETLLFSHQYHVIEEEMSCSDCHSVDESATGLDNLLPAKDICADCHNVNDESSCNQCHSNVEAATNAVRIDKYSPLFSHEKHVAAKLECVTCHGKVDDIGISQHLELPDMIDCMDCHQNTIVANDCQTCHNADERIKPLNHDLAFMKTHGNIASNFVPTMGKDCATCHKTDFCQDCHEGENIDRFAHPLNFEFTHALTAQGREKNCFTCHEDREFCSSCHSDLRIYPHDHQRAGWIIGTDGGQHKIAAMIDLESCMSCHEGNTEENCQQCHTN